MSYYETNHENTFRNDNTEGYSESDLVALNDRFEAASIGVDDLDELDRIAERVLVEFDQQHNAANH